MNSDLFIAALSCFAAGAFVDLSLGARVLWVRTLPYWFAVLGSGALVVVGVHATTGPMSSSNISSLLGVGNEGLRFDALAGLFLSLLFGITILISLNFVSWVRATSPTHHRVVAPSYLLLLGAVATIVCAKDAFLFLFAWESLTLSFYLLTSATRTSTSQVSASWATVGIGKVSGAALLFGFLLLAGRTGNLDIASWHAVAPGTLHDVAWVMVVVGFGAKLGLVPFQVWIPVGYPAAPGPARAAMAGVAANVGVYGLWRFLGVLGSPPTWLAVVVLLLGGATALLGITFAGVQSRLSRVVAYSSVENAGLIVTAYGVALTGSIMHSRLLMAAGLVAATLQVVAHAVAKSALFAALANIETAAGTDNLDDLRGVGRKMPWSGAAFAAGSLTMAGLPPTIGFVSEWFILEVLMQQFRVSSLALRLALAGAGALVALTAGISALVFLRVLGLTFLGRPATALTRVRPAPWATRVAVTVLGGACLAIAALSPWEIRYIARGLNPLVATHFTLDALKSPWVLQPVFAAFSILSPSWLWIIMPLMFSAVFLGALVLSRGRYFKTRRVESWHSASSGVRGPSSYTSFGFANPLRHVLGNVLGSRRTVEHLRRDDPRRDDEDTTHVEAATSIVEPFETYFYRPLREKMLVVSRVAKRLQSGNLNAYVAYMLIVLLAILAVTAGLH